MVRPPRLRWLLVVAGCLALVGALVPSGSVAAAGHPTQSSSINDTASTRRVQLIAGGLVVLGIGLIGITVWFWRSTRPDPESLAPLDLMGKRRWRRLDPIEQRHRLDSVRAHLNDEAAEAARQTVPPVPAPPSPVLAPLATASPSADEPVAADAGVPSPSLAPSPSIVATATATGEDVPGERANVHGDPLVRAMERAMDKDADPG
ncbi:MAG: hypothetical protein AB7Q42_13430 [Acidimicrobiia bacterium]